MKIILNLNYDCCNNPWNKVTYEIKFTWMGLAMMTLPNVQNTIHQNYNINLPIKRVKGKQQKNLGLNHIKRKIFHPLQ